MDIPTKKHNDSRGFTLIELLIGIVIMAILMAIAIPSYQSYITKSRARTASADLVALATDLENAFQRTLSYPVLTTTTTADTSAATIGWNPADDDYFTFSVTSTASTYTLTAAGVSTLAGCNLTLTDANVRTSTSNCGFTSW